MWRSSDIFFASSLQSSSGWNFRGTGGSLQLRCDSLSLVTTLRSAVGIERQWTDPLAALAWMSTHFVNSTNARWVGYLSYDFGRLFEKLPSHADDDLGLPLFVFSLHDGASAGSPPLVAHPMSSASVTSSLPRPEYLKRVVHAIEYINAGDIFQVNLAQRFTAGLTLQPHQIWKSLTTQFPASYGACLDFGDHALLCNSPELFMRVTSDRRIMTRPIKGTRPRLPGMETELRNSVKDQAELTMIVDLERNDLGRVCEIGSVKVSEPRSIETHPTLYHGVATVEGVLRPEVAFVDLLRATFPGGSITGAPKIRAMEIIDELEPVRRGPYCGAIGYLAADGSMQFNIAIRTMIVKDGLVQLSVGGGIVADSDPAEEYDETLVKAAAMFNVLGIVL